MFFLECKSLNIGSFDGLLAWLSFQAIDVVFVQESHWKHTSEWITTQYYCIHSSSGSAHQAGLLTLIAKRLCSLDHLSWKEIIPGRLVHIRLHGRPHCIDLLHGYQYVMTANVGNSRSAFWDLLQETLQLLPSRNILIAAGDFNTTIPRGSTAVGLCNFLPHDHKRVTGRQHSDWQRFANILTTFNLIALNTWHEADGPTFSSDQGQSRIDYICVKSQHADKIAREVHHLSQMPLIPLSGSRHMPLLTSIIRKWYPCSLPSRDGWSVLQRRAIHQCWQRNDAAWTSTLSAVNECFDHVKSNPPATLHHFHTTLKNSLHKPDVPPPQTIIPSSSPLKIFWFHTHALQHIHSITTRSIFQVWRHVLCRRKARKAMQQHSKSTRKAKIKEVLQHARAAADSKDQYELFHHIRKISPKTAYRRIQLRDANGEPLDPQSSADAISDWLTTLYFSSQPCNFPSNVDWFFTTDAIDNAFKQLRSTKALAPNYAPALIWKTASRSGIHHHGFSMV